MAQCTATLDAVVVGLNEIEHGATGEWFAVSQLHLQSVSKALGHRVVATVADSTHAARRIRALEQSLVRP